MSRVINDENARNLQIALQRLEKYKAEGDTHIEKFSMKDWFIVDGPKTGRCLLGLQEVPSEPCGTVACLLGHIVFYMSLSKKYPQFQVQKGEGYVDYGMRLFSPKDTDWCGGADDVFDFLFDFQWFEVDNTFEGALARMRYMIENRGVPHWFSSAHFDEFGEEYKNDIAPYLVTD